ncbi:MAG: SoxR reducing system RseC family protein [Syntrophobacterales bacterium]|jgi:sigma-E factor negative regulatory protein RseC|nr:SoxR reducing system RseC family protein [Syntrophobacterales bacterium]
MLEEEAIVVEAHGMEAKVQMEKKSACRTCSASSICHPVDHDFVDVVNPVGALKGQKVKVVVEPSLYVKASVLIYGLPVIVFFLAAVAAKALAVRFFGEPYSDLYAFFAACASMAAVFAVIIFCMRKGRASQDYRPVIVEIL